MRDREGGGGGEGEGRKRDELKKNASLQCVLRIHRDKYSGVSYSNTTGIRVEDYTHPQGLRVAHICAFS